MDDVTLFVSTLRKQGRRFLQKMNSSEKTRFCQSLSLQVSHRSWSSLCEKYMLLIPLLKNLDDPQIFQEQLVIWKIPLKRSYENQLKALGKKYVELINYTKTETKNAIQKRLKSLKKKTHGKKDLLIDRLLVTLLPFKPLSYSQEPIDLKTSQVKIETVQQKHKRKRFNPKRVIQNNTTRRAKNKTTRKSQYNDFAMWSEHDQYCPTLLTQSGKQDLSISINGQQVEEFFKTIYHKQYQNLQLQWDNVKNLMSQSSNFNFQISPKDFQEQLRYLGHLTREDWEQISRFFGINPKLNNLFYLLPYVPLIKQIQELEQTEKDQLLKQQFCSRQK
ncbi:hypothetical protein M0813_07468 [Anaeramoeba flamelloides]|uniref:SAP domain-containing protein n=1 Tax=Anaeramoeba flamelloides TaxID=1746091 RepID=A0ABQ8XE26_9EUKA|nr:hypothetical protein M0813_07468 [Anaeramoeba flamelloides]